VANGSATTATQRPERGKHMTLDGLEALRHWWHYRVWRVDEVAEPGGESIDAVSR
jgi:hypothetical protein